MKLLEIFICKDFDIKKKNIKTFFVGRKNCHLKKLQNGVINCLNCNFLTLREVEHLKEQLFKAKIEMCQNAKKSSDLNEKLRTQGAGNQIRQQYLAEVEEKTIQWKKMTSDLRRRLVSAGARSSKMSGACEKQERVAKACSEIEKVQANLVENMLDDDIAMLQKRSSAVDVCLGSPIPIEAKEIVEKLSGDFTVSEIGASLLSNLNKFVIWFFKIFNVFPPKISRCFFFIN